MDPQPKGSGAGKTLLHLVCPWNGPCPPPGGQLGGLGKKANKLVEGILSLIYSVQDQAVEENGIPEEKVFGKHITYAK